MSEVNNSASSHEHALTARVLEHLPAPAGYLDSDLTVVFANGAASRAYQRPLNEVVGHPVSELLGPEIFDHSEPFMKAALAGEPQEFQRSQFDALGQPYFTTVRLIPDVVDDVTVGLFFLVSDVTELVVAQQQLERANEQYRAIARSLPGSFVLLFDFDLVFTVAAGSLLEL